MRFLIGLKGDIVQQHTKEGSNAASPASFPRRRAPYGYRSSTARTLGSHNGFERHPLSGGTSEAARPLSRSTFHTSRNLPLGWSGAPPGLSTCARNLRRQCAAVLFAVRAVVLLCVRRAIQMPRPLAHIMIFPWPDWNTGGK